MAKKKRRKTRKRRKKNEPTSYSTAVIGANPSKKKKMTKKQKLSAAAKLLREAGISIRADQIKPKLSTKKTTKKKTTKRKKATKKNKTSNKRITTRVMDWLEKEDLHVGSKFVNVADRYKKVGITHLLKMGAELKNSVNSAQRSYSASAKKMKTFGNMVSRSGYAIYPHGPHIVFSKKK